MTCVTVLGAGLVGSTVALTLRSSGASVTLVGARRISDADAQSDPTFASAFPAASVIAHSVEGERAGELARRSEDVFQLLSRLPQAWVRRQTHAELFEREDHVPPAPPGLRHVEIVGDENARRFPRRPGVERVFGFSYPCFFCTMPHYGRWLDRTVDAARIRFVRRRLDPESIANLDGDVFVNCLGYGASEVFGEEPGAILRGILVECPLEAPPGPALSYNYTPSAEVFSFDDGHPADVYFYPRAGHCVLGGTREPGRLDASGRFESLRPMTQVDTVLADGVDVPRPILDLNAELVRLVTGRRPGRPRRVLVGYRHLAEREGPPGYRLGPRTEEVAGRQVIDCFGFGGAGVTLSWGAALEVGDLLASMGALAAEGGVETLRRFLE